jgi:hypothetical protein
MRQVSAQLGAEGLEPVAADTLRLRMAAHVAEARVQAVWGEQQLLREAVVAESALGERPFYDELSAGHEAKRAAGVGRVKGKWSDSNDAAAAGVMPGACARRPPTHPLRRPTPARTRPLHTPPRRPRGPRRSLGTQGKVKDPPRPPSPTGGGRATPSPPAALPSTRRFDHPPASPLRCVRGARSRSPVGRPRAGTTTKPPLPHKWSKARTIVPSPKPHMRDVAEEIINRAEPVLNAVHGKPTIQQKRRGREIKAAMLKRSLVKPSDASLVGCVDDPDDSIYDDDDDDGGGDDDDDLEAAEPPAAAIASGGAFVSQATTEELQAGGSPRAASPAGVEAGEEDSAAARLQAGYRGKARAYAQGGVGAA